MICFLELDFNCNSFTNDCVGFLTGGTIPSFIKGASLDSDIMIIVLDRFFSLYRSANGLLIDSFWCCDATYD